MSDDIDLFWESLISPGGNKGEAKSNKSKNESKRKNNITLNTDDIIPKKKKISTFKDVMQSKKGKKKKKKKKKVLDLNSLFGSSDATVTVESKPDYDMSNMRISGNNSEQKSDCTIQDSKKKKGQRKKKVVFDLPHDCACAKHPNFVSAPPNFPKDCTELMKASRTDCEWTSPASAIVQHQSQPQDNDIQWDESNSQDLFITQNTFRPSPSESSEESSYKATSTASQQTEILHYLGHVKYHNKDSCQHPRKKKHQKTAKTRSTQKDRLHSRKKKYSVQTEGASPTREEEPSCSFYARPNVMKLYDDADADKLPKVAKSKQHHHKQIQQTYSCSLHIPAKPTTCTSTQTENFFTAELSSYLAFSTKRRLAACSDVLKPLDLSLPQRARKDTSSEVKEDETSHRAIRASPFCCSAMKELEDKKVVGGSDKRKGASPLTESQSKSGDTTASSDCNGQSKTVDLYQVRPVQMRLNESFFFKTKGDGQSPRPASPLMKLSQSRVSDKDLKGKKKR
ncbi:uncharacterized protein LOC144015866 [Festucalex cinctus]